MTARTADVSKIDTNWVKGLRVWVKKMTALSLYNTHYDVYNHLKRFEKRDLPRLREYLFHTKGLLPRTSDSWMSIIDKLKIKIDTDLKAADKVLDEALSTMSFTLESMTPGTSAYLYSISTRQFYENRYSPPNPERALLEGFEEIAKGTLEKVDAILSGKLLRAVSAFLERYAQGEPFEQEEILLEYDIGNVKMIFDDIRDSRNPELINNPANKSFSATTLKDFIPYFQKAKALLDRKGFSKLWYGPIYISCPSCGGENQHGSQLGVGAHYNFQKDHVKVFMTPRPFITEALIHELGHRYWFKLMDQSDRARFDSYFGEVAAVSDYGGKASEEDFAEVFAHFVLGRDMSRDQIERFKAFLTKEDRGRLARKVASGAMLKLAFETKRWGPFVFEIDRPAGFVKEWPQPDGSVMSYTYPVDYGYFVQHTGEDSEGLDAFVGDDPQGKIESFLKLQLKDGQYVPDETKFLVGLSDDEREKVMGLYKPEEVVGLREYEDFYELLAVLNAFRDTKKTGSTQMNTKSIQTVASKHLAGLSPARVASRHLKANDQDIAQPDVEHTDPLLAMAESVLDLEGLAADVQVILETYLSVVPMPNVGRIAGVQIHSQTECFSKCEQGLRLSTSVIIQARAYLLENPGNPTASQVMQDAQLLYERFEGARGVSREVLSAISQKILPEKLKTVLETVLYGLRAELVQPNSATMTVFPRFAPGDVNGRAVDGVVFDGTITVYPDPKSQAVPPGLPEYQQFVFTQSTLGDTSVYFQPVDRQNIQPVLDATEVQSGEEALKLVIDLLKGWRGGTNWTIGGTMSKDASGQYMEVRSLPPALQKALKGVGYGRKDIKVEGRDTYTVQGFSGEGERSFAVAVDLASGQTKEMKGSWGGGGYERNQVDMDDKSYPLPPNGAVIVGTEGRGKPAYAVMYVNPGNLQALLPSGKGDELTKEEIIALQIVKGIKGGARQEYFTQYELGVYNGTNPLLQSLAKKGLVKVTGAGVQVTTAGKSMAESSPKLFW